MLTRMLLVTVVSLLFSTAALAQHARHIHLNGVHLQPEAILQLDALAGTYVPDGAYWFNAANGTWGYEGNPFPQGRVGAAQPSVNPTGPGYNRRGLFGDSMSDGKCSFVNGVPVGDC